MQTSIVVVYNYKNKKLSKDDTAPIHLLIQSRINGKRYRKYIRTPFEVKKSQFDDNKKEVKNHTQAYAINKALRDKVKDITDFLYNLAAEGKELTEESINAFLNNNEEDSVDFISFYENNIDKYLKRGTTKEHYYTLNVLKEFRNRIPFKAINLKLIMEIDNFLKGKGFMKNTIYKHHQHIKRFLKIAEMQGLFDVKNNPYQHFKVSKEKSERTNITAKELERIEQLDYDENFYDLKLAKDLFLFSCYTGLRFSDVQTLEKSHIKDSAEGLVIVKRMEKVPKPIVLPLDLLFEGKPKIIIQEYLERTNGDRVFPEVSNQHINRLLKTIAYDAKIKTRLTFHVARHTFGSLLAEITQNPYLIMNLMGHADIDTSMIYIHLSQERINRQLRTINWKLD